MMFFPVFSATRMAAVRRGALPLLLALNGLCAVAAPGAAPAAAPPAEKAPDITAAERALFLEPALTGLKMPLALAYSFRRTGSLDAPFDDQVILKLTARPGGACCAADVAFLTGERNVKLPEIDLAEANPVLMGFLEHDIREMERATGGKANYFRKRIRLALAAAPALTPRTLTYQGKAVAGTEISIAPYADDPMRQRYEKLADKRYVFWRSAAVPGRLYGIRTVVPGTHNGAAVAGTELWLNGAAPAPSPAVAP